MSAGRIGGAGIGEQQGLYELKTAASLAKTSRLIGDAPGGPLTLAGWINEKLGRSPEPGEVVHLDGLTVVARKLRRKKIYEGIVSSTEKIA